MNAAEYLARVGFDHLLHTRLGGRAPLHEYEGYGVTQEGEAEARRARTLADMVRVHELLTDRESRPLPRPGDLNGAKWIGMVLSWPDRVPGLKCWAGRSTLPQIITQRRAALRKWDGKTSLLEWTTFPAHKSKGAKDKGTDPDEEDMREGKGHSGIDSYPCVNALDAGFSPHAVGIPVAYRPGLELLAIIGIETVPLVSFAPRRCGFVHAGKVWRFAVEDRDGDRKKWGDVKEYDLFENELDYTAEANA